MSLSVRRSRAGTRSTVTSSSISAASTSATSSRSGAPRPTARRPAPGASRHPTRLMLMTGPPQVVLLGRTQGARRDRQHPRGAPPGKPPVSLYPPLPVLRVTTLPRPSHGPLPSRAGPAPPATPQRLSVPAPVQVANVAALLAHAWASGSLSLSLLKPVNLGRLTDGRHAPAPLRPPLRPYARGAATPRAGSTAVRSQARLSAFGSPSGASSRARSRTLSTGTASPASPARLGPQSCARRVVGSSASWSYRLAAKIAGGDRVSRGPEAAG